MAENTKTIAIFGTSKASPDQEVFKLAYSIGYALAKQGFIIANGGYGGTMLASAKGAFQAGGKIIGVTCSAFGRGPANKYISEEIHTDSLDQRLHKLLELGDAYIVLPGGTGTLLELASTWELKNKHLAPANKPIIIVSDFWEPLAKMMAQIDPDSTKYIESAAGPEDILKILHKY